MHKRYCTFFAKNSMLAFIPLVLLVVVFFEELFKHLTVVLFGKDKIKSVSDSIELHIIAALGFAFIENIYFFLNQLQNLQTIISPENIEFILYRTIIVTLMHLLASAIFGFFYAFSLFHPSKVSIAYLFQRNAKLSFVAKFEKFLVLEEEKGLYVIRKWLEGFMFAMLFHLFYNLAVGFHSIIQYVIIPLVFFLGVLLLNHELKNHQNKKGSNTGKQENRFVYSHTSAFFTTIVRTSLLLFLFVTVFTNLNAQEEKVKYIYLDRNQNVSENNDMVHNPSVRNQKDISRNNEFEIEQEASLLSRRKFQGQQQKYRKNTRRNQQYNEGGQISSRDKSIQRLRNMSNSIRTNSGRNVPSMPKPNRQESVQNENKLNSLLNQLKSLN